MKERFCACNFLELLTETNADIRQGVSPVNDEATSVLINNFIQKYCKIL